MSYGHDGPPTAKKAKKSVPRIVNVTLPIKRANLQYGPWPQDLEDIVKNLKLTNKPEYTNFELRTDYERDHAGVHSGAAGGLTFIVFTNHKDAYHDQSRGVAHLFVVPAATYNRKSWLRWVFDRLLDIERHEIGEGMVVGNEDEGYERPFAPTHGPGDDPYVTVQYATDEQRRTSFKGKVKAEVTHQYPPRGSGLTPCCGKTPFELPSTDRMAIDVDLVTCNR